MKKKSRVIFNPSMGTSTKSPSANWRTMDGLGIKPRHWSASKKFFKASVPPRRIFTDRSAGFIFNADRDFSKAFNVPDPRSRKATGVFKSCFNVNDFPANGLLAE